MGETKSSNLLVFSSWPGICYERWNYSVGHKTFLYPSPWAVRKKERDRHRQRAGESDNDR